MARVRASVLPESDTMLADANSGKRVQVATPEGWIFEPEEMLGGVYEVRGLLGSGGMGQVFEARDRLLDRPVAIKAMWPRPGAPPLLAEARALAVMSHPGLPTVYAMGVHREIPYMVMERIVGTTLTESVRAIDGAVRITVAVGWITRIAESLSVVHEAGLVHRDVKPDNVMITPRGRVVLMDLGLGLPNFSLGAQESIMGTPWYMAPEALANQVDASNGFLADIYSIGAIAYELLAGKRPREASTLTELVSLHGVPLERLETLRSDIPEALSALVHDMLASDPHLRPMGLQAVLFRLGSIPIEDDAAAHAPPKTRVLIVDDDPAITKVMSFYVKRALGDRVEIRTAQNGEEAIEQLRTAPPNVMLLDLHMPRMNGIEVVMYLRGAGIADRCTIIAVSAGAQESDKQLLAQLGIRHFILKGQELQNRLTSVLRTLCPTASAP